MALRPGINPPAPTVQSVQKTYWVLRPTLKKMLYDNALLSRVYLHAYQASGDTQVKATQALLESVYGRYLPNKVLVVAGVEQAGELSQRIPLLADRTKVDGAATAYVCENYVCMRY